MERCALCVHLVEKDPERPPVNRVCVATFGEDLGRDIVWRATHGVGHVTTCFEQLAQAEVGQLNVPVSAEQHILRLQVPVDDSLGVKVLETKNDF